MNKISSTIIGLILVVTIGSLVYFTKKPSNILLENYNVQTVVNEDTPPIKSENSDKKAGEMPAPSVDKVPTTLPPSIVTEPKPKQPEPQGISLSQISLHNSRTSCWSAINGNVYDLTSWIPNHPGGERNILSICGIDGSGAYNGEHGSKSKPAKILFGFKIGVFAN